MGTTETSSAAVWTYVGGTAIGVATLTAGVYVTVAGASSTFHWTAIPMLATYGCGVLAVVSLLGMTRGWPFPFVRGEEAEKDNPPVPVSAEHGIQLREEAKQWADSFGRFLQPDWAVRPLELEPLDSDEGLAGLRPIPTGMLAGVAWGLRSGRDEDPGRIVSIGCMNRRTRLVGRCRPPVRTGAHHDRSAQCR